MAISSAAFALLIVCSVAQPDVLPTCVAHEDGPGCPHRGAAMIQRTPHQAPQKRAPHEAPQKGKSLTPQLHRTSAEARHAKHQVLSPDERETANTQATVMGKQAVAVQVMLKRAMDKVAETPLPDNELDQLIFNLMAGQSNSQDACPAKLLEAKHQLNQLHKHMYTVAYEINSSSREVLVTSREIETLEAQWKTEQRECTKGKEKCTTETSYYKEQWEILKWELIEMRQIANPAITITSSDMSYAAFKSREESEEETKTNFSDSWSDSTEDVWEDSGKGHVPEYAGPGEAPQWWPVLLEARAEPVNSSGGMSPAQAVSSLVMKTKEHAKDLEECFKMFQLQNTSGQSAAFSMLAKNGKNSGPIEGSYGNADKGGNYQKNSESIGPSENSQGEFNDLGGWGTRNKSAARSESSYEEDWSKSLTNTSSSFSNVSEACKIQLIAFEETYYKAYKSVTRLVSEYEVLVNSTECEDEVDEGCREQDAEYSIKSKKQTEKLSELTEKMTRVKGHITVTSNQEKALTVHIKHLSTACADLGETVSDLDKVRDAIQVFGVCAGMGRPSFHIPSFAKFVEIEFDTSDMSDSQIDMSMQKACFGIDLTLEGHNARAAETGEIMQQAIDGMPTTNTAGSVLLGTCPHCEGENDEQGGPQHATGHYRSCWDAGAELDGPMMRTNCGHLSYKAIMCVFDKFDVTTSSGEVTSSITSGGSSSSSTSSGSSSSSSSSSAFSATR